MMSIFSGAIAYTSRKNCPSLFAHDNQAIGKAGYRFEYTALFSIWIPQNSVQGCHHRHLELMQKGEDVAASDARRRFHIHVEGRPGRCH